MKDDLLENDPRTRKKYYLQMTPARSFLTETARHLFQVFTKTIVTRIGQLPSEGGVILAANHLTNFDVFPIQFAVQRPIFFMGKAELFKNPLMDIAYRQLGGFPVYRGENDEWAMQHAKKVLEQGLVLGMFPEGTRSHATGLRTAKTGTARLALITNRPIMPVALYGTHNISKKFPRQTEIHLTFGNLIIPDPKETSLSLTDRMMFALAEMLPADARGVYMYRPAGF